ncbi:hypothetical protein CPC08DRAFT_759719 [Agrocybe pediades]|nr:hypothetical protein CPC08DRAFT_759719 [Agrocybe pediades]
MSTLPLLPTMEDTTDHLHIAHLERVVCSNYTCCGDSHCDLHALIEHFEDKHLEKTVQNAKYLYPRERLRSVALQGKTPRISAPSAPSSPSSSSATSSPVSSAPSSPTSDFTSPAPSHPFSSMTLTPVYTPFTPISPVDPSDSYLDTDEIFMRQEAVDYDMSGIGMYADFSPEIYASSCESKDLALEVPLIIPMTPSLSDQEAGMDDVSHSSPDLTLESPPSPLAAIPRHMQLEVDTVPLTAAYKKATKTKLLKAKSPRSPSTGLASTIAGPSSNAQTTKVKSPKTSSSKSRNGTATASRPKKFMCPAPGCPKSYLTLNGLQYHEKNQRCEFRERGPGANSYSDSSMSNSPPSVTSSQSPPVDILTHEASPGLSRRIYACPESSSAGESSDPSSSVPSVGAPLPGGDVSSSNTHVVPYYRQSLPATSSQAPLGAGAVTTTPVTVVPAVAPSPSQPQYHYPLPAPVSMPASPAAQNAPQNMNATHSNVPVSQSLPVDAPSQPVYACLTPQSPAPVAA